ncbi:sulfide/dihydroorotate dehydrogenase-like FAD/NAD-binding protein [Verrucomicrobiota bacterium]
MNKIIEKKQLSDQVFMMRVEAPLIAEERKAGQFIILQLNDDFAERIPLTISDANPTEGTITLIFQTVGFTTKQLAKLNEGDSIANIVGPLGQPTHIEKVGKVVCVGGGVGIAPLHPIAKALKNADNEVISILGSRNKDLLILEDEMREISNETIVCTDDGSSGRQCLVTEPLKELCESDNPPDLVVAIGPMIMMKFCCETTRPYKVPTVVSLNTIMIDGTGMCGGCRCTVGGKTKFVCVDGPEFDGHLVDFDNLLNRSQAYKPKEEADNHKCKMEAAAAKLEKRK